MQHLTNAVRNAIKGGNWYAALALALALPDICGFLETGKPGSQRRYVEWCKRYLVQKYTPTVGPQRATHVFLSAEDCYALRCAFLHNGSDNITTQRARKALDEFVFIVPPPNGGVIHMNQSNNRLQLQVDIFAEDLCLGVDQWALGVAPSIGVRDRMKDVLIVQDIANRPFRF